MIATPIHQTHRGFSLIEMLLYLAITVTLASALVTTFLSLDTTLIRNRVERELTEAAQMSLEQMVRTIRNAHSVNTAQSTLGTSPGTLAVVESGSTTAFSISNGRLVMSINGTQVGPLTSDAVTVKSLTFHHHVGSTFEMVRAELVLSTNHRTSSSTRTYYTSAVLRGAYE
jgi:type II secretory pathway pseudopilin PulG